MGGPGLAGTVRSCCYTRILLKQLLSTAAFLLVPRISSPPTLTWRVGGRASAAEPEQVHTACGRRCPRRERRRLQGTRARRFVFSFSFKSRFPVVLMSAVVPSAKWEKALIPCHTLVEPPCGWLREVKAGEVAGPCVAELARQRSKSRVSPTDTSRGRRRSSCRAQAWGIVLAESRLSRSHIVYKSKTVSFWLLSDITN